MRKKISGNQYDYFIELSHHKNGSSFRILCLSKKDNRKSAITNVNTVIGEIIEPVLKTNEIEGSAIDVNMKTGKKLFANAVDTFTDKYWVAYLEKNLDKDKEEGGWNSKFKF